MMTKRVEFREVAEGATFSAEYGEHGQKRATFRKTAFNMGRCLDGDWPMPFLVDEKVDIVCPNATAHVRAVASNVEQIVGSSEVRQLGRWDACPAGNQLQPGCPICRACQWHIGTEWNNGGMYGYHLTDCNMPNNSVTGAGGVP